MKNLKNTLVAIGLAAVLGVGAVSANAGVITRDSSNKGTKGQCSVKNKNVLKQFASVIIAGLSGQFMTAGLIMSDGSILSDAPCNPEEGNTEEGKTDGEILTNGFRCR